MIKINNSHNTTSAVTYVLYATLLDITGSYAFLNLHYHVCNKLLKMVNYQ